MKNEAVEMCAIRFRVKIRKAGIVTEDMAWDAIAEVLNGRDVRFTVSANDVLRAARRMNARSWTR